MPSMNKPILRNSDQETSPRQMKDLLCWFIRIVSLLFSLVILFWMLVSPTFRDVEGFLTGKAVLCFSLAVAAVIIGWTVCSTTRNFGLWLALGLVCQAAALQAIDAGKSMHFQHYKPFGSLVVEQPWLILILALQSIAVGYGITRKWRVIRNWLFKNFALWQLIFIMLALVLGGAALSVSIRFYLYELALVGYLVFLNLGNLILCISAIPSQEAFNINAFFEKLLSHPRVASSGEKPLNLISVFGALWVFAVSASLSYFVYQNHPHIPDEISYLFQARYFARGLLSVQAPPVPEAFSFYLIPYRSDHWYSVFPPGWSALLAIGVLLGKTWLINPLLGGLNVVLSYKLARDLYTLKIARWVVFLLCISPWFIFMTMNLMSHTLALTLALIGILMMELSRKKGNHWYGLISGIVVGALSLVRPYDAAILIIPMIIWMIGLDGRKFQSKTILFFGLGVALSGSLNLLYNEQIAGNVLNFPLESYYRNYFGPEVNALGFGPARGMGWKIDAFPGHSPMEGVLNSLLNFFSVNVELFGWSIGSLLLVTLFVVSGKFSRTDLLMLLIVFGIILFYSFYWFHGGPDFGARYWYLSLFPLVVLTVRGMEVLSAKLGNQSESSIHPELHIILAVLILSFYSLVNYLPWRAIDKYFHYLNMRPDIRILAEEADFGKSLVLIRGDRSPDYTSTWVYNPLNFDAVEPIFAYDEENQSTEELIKAYSDRDFWIVLGPTLTGRTYEIFAGPLQGNEVMKK